MQPVARVASSVMFVATLERSVDFYRDVFACEVAIHAEDAALLVAPGGFQIYLKARGGSTQHASGGIGVQNLMWATDTRADLDRLEQILRERGSHIDTHTRDQVSFVEGRDPDGIRILIAHPSPDQLPRESLDPRLYGW